MTDVKLLLVKAPYINVENDLVVKYIIEISLME